MPGLPRRNYNSLYLNCVYASKERTQKLKAAFAAAGKKLDMGKSVHSLQKGRRAGARRDPRREIASTTPEEFIRIYEEARTSGSWQTS